MLDDETFLTTLYEEVATICKQEPALAGQAAAWDAVSLTLAEVLTLVLFGQFARFGSERGFYRFAEAHLRPLFPRLPERTQFNRLQRRAHDALVALGQLWAAADEQLAVAAREVGAGAYEAVDTFGAVVRNVKRRGHGWLDGQADLGACTRLGWYTGLRVLTCVTPSGALSGYGVAAGSAKEQPMADTFFAARAARKRAAPQPRLLQVGTSTSGGCYVTDTGFEGKRRHQVWEAAYGAHVLTPPKRRQQAGRWPRRLRRQLAGWRQIVESVHAHLLSTFRLERERPHTLDGFLARLAAKVSLHNFCHWLNRTRGRPPLAFADLLAA
jgi:hypothetical protein